MKVNRARFPPAPKYCAQCRRKLVAGPANGSLACPNAAKCDMPVYWGPQSQVVSAAIIPIRMRDGRRGLVYVQHVGAAAWELPAGFNPLGECARDCGKREAEEEATVSPDADRAVPVDFETVPEGHGVVFHLYPDIHEDDLPAFVPNDEKQDRKIGFDWRDLRFSTHQHAARDFFAGRFDAWPARVPAPA